ncbi:hypothetical protein ACHAW6_003681 [Cyclotella cf. meneghiniana]
MHKQPAMDTGIYEVCVLYICTKELTANAITEALYAQCDPGSNQYSWIIKRIPMLLSLTTIRSRLVGVRRMFHAPPEVGSCIVNGRMAELLGRSCQITKSLTLECALYLRSQITSLIKFRSAYFHKWSHKFGIELPKTVEEAYTIDKATGTTFWHNAIKLEINNYMQLHMIVDVKIEDFCHKAQHIAGEHMTKALATLTYARIML